MQFFKTPNINFVAFRRTTLIASAVVILVGAASIALHRGLKMSIDFAGGALVEVRTTPPIPLQDLRTIVSSGGFEGAEITRFGAENEYLIKVKSIANADSTAKQIIAVIRDGAAGHTVELRRRETVGPRIGAELRKNALWAIIYSLRWNSDLCGMALRFPFRGGVDHRDRARRLADAGLFLLHRHGDVARRAGGGADDRRLLAQRHRGGVRPHS